MNELHKLEMEKAYKEALDKYLAEHPEHKDLQLKNDPKKMLEDIIKKAEASKKARELQEARVRELQQQHQNMMQAQGAGNQAGQAQPGQDRLAHAQQQLARIRAHIIQNQAYLQQNAAIRAANPAIPQIRLAAPNPMANTAVRAPIIANPNPVQWQQQAPRHAQPNPNNQYR